MDIKARIEQSVQEAVSEELGSSIHPDKLNAVISRITGRLATLVTPDELVLLGIKQHRDLRKEMAVVSVIGEDSVGIVADVTRILAENRANIEGMNQAIVSGYFALILTIDISGMKVPIDELQKLMDQVAGQKHLKIYIQHENIFTSMNRI
ncbi:MAG TPA: ACT domain-containing protein [Spirochaetota bacterium]|nr:ACT domain-containing protein [Spirochaetota bacterium]